MTSLFLPSGGEEGVLVVGVVAGRLGELELELVGLDGVAEACHLGAHLAE